MAKGERVAEMPVGMTAVDLTDTPTRKRDGSIGKATFEAINELTAGGKMNRQAAFVEYGRRTGARPGTVAANFYRIARQQGAVNPRRATAKATRTGSQQRRRPTKAPINGADEIDQLVGRLSSDIEALADALRAEATSNAELRRRLDSLRTVLG